MKVKRKRFYHLTNQNLTWNSAQFDVFVHSKASLSSVASASLGLEEIWFEKQNEQLWSLCLLCFSHQKATKKNLKLAVFVFYSYSWTDRVVISSVMCRGQKNGIPLLLWKPWSPYICEAEADWKQKRLRGTWRSIDYTINTYTGGIGIEEIQNAAKSMHRGLYNVLHSTEGDPEGAMMTRVIGFLRVW